MSKLLGSRIAGIGPTWFERRQLGLRNPLGTRDFINEQIYSSIFPCEFWDGAANSASASVHGGVFCLEFSPEGSILVAAYEKRSVLLFDPLTYKETYTIENAHLDCVNCVKFLDSRSFATCSDDCTVALWDARNLTQKVRILKGHTNWVKNIEYAPDEGLLVTSGFDGNILTWEMNKYRENGNVHTKVFGTNGLMRTCLTPDASKMIMCTTGGYLIVIHNLDLNRLTQDMDGFKPNMYRLMQLSQTVLPIASDFTPLFRGRGKRNRVEFITDFPKGDDAEVVSSLQVHPDGHSVISRNVSNGELSEWSCIHNIEERLTSDESEGSEPEDNGGNTERETENWPGYSSSISTTPSYIIQHAHAQNERNGPIDEELLDPSQRDLSISPADVWEALVAIQEARVRRERDRAPEVLSRPVFRRQIPDAGSILVRPIHSGPEGRIFETRLPQNSNSAGGEGQERASQSGENANSSDVPHRSGFIHTIDEIDSDRSEIRESSRESSPLRFGSRFRRSLPLRQRYSTLYRRSLVGRYDRTSITRRPIFRGCLSNIRPRRLRNRPKLHTNYEMNETQRLQDEGNQDESQIINLDSGPSSSNAEGPCTSGLRTREIRRFILGRRVQPRSGNGARNRPASALEIAMQPIGPTVNSLYNRFRVIESNLNSIRERVTTFEGRIHSTLQFLRNYNMRLSLNGSNDSLNNNESLNGFNSENDEDDVLSRNDRNAIDRERATFSLRSAWNTRGPETIRIAGDPNNPIFPSPSGSERTILMGVFRTGIEDGVRGTSMRRHNIAAVTVSSRSNRAFDSSTDGLDRVRIGGSSENGALQPAGIVPVNKRIHQNIKRLTHYIEEPNLGKGFIKEVSISPDGRVICSPFGNGIRLLSFSPTVQDLSHCYPAGTAIPLHELSLNMAHTDTVLSTRFSPFHNVLVSGCLSGKIVYYQPLL